MLLAVFVLKERFKSEIVKTMLISDKPMQSGPLFVENKEHHDNSESKNDIKVGFITSALKSFNLNKFIGIGYINKDYTLEGCIYTKDRKERKNIVKLKDNLIEVGYYKKCN